MNYLMIIGAILIIGVATQNDTEKEDKCSKDYICPPEYLRLSQNCYFFSKEEASWQDAFYNCQDHHGKLVMIRNAMQDKLLRIFLNKISLLPVQWWIGGMYDWRQMMWKWGASGKEIKYKGFSRMNPNDTEGLKWHCALLNPELQYKWSARSCIESKHYICQAKLRKLPKKDRKRYRSKNINDVPLPDVSQELDVSVGNLKDQVPARHDLFANSAFASRNHTVLLRKGRRRGQRKNRLCQNFVVINGTRYELPQPKYGKRRRRNKSKENKESKESKDGSIETKVYYSHERKSPLHPRIITEEFTFP